MPSPLMGLVFWPISYKNKQTMFGSGIVVEFGNMAYDDGNTQPTRAGDGQFSFVDARSK